jgi:M6 family metalloprotease-like protein
MRRLLAVALAAAALITATVGISPVGAAVPLTVARPSGARPHGGRPDGAARDDVGARHTGPTLQPLTGVQHWVILRCAYQALWSGSSQRTQNTGAYFTTMFGNTMPFLGNYWNAASYGNISISAAVAGASTEWRTVAEQNSYFGADQNDQDQNKLADACAAAWDTAVTFSAGTDYGFVYDQSAGADYGGRFFFAANYDGQTSVVGAMMGGQSQQHEETWAHEMGHAFGLMHSFGGDAQPYDTAYDIMSAPAGECVTHGGGSWWGGDGNDPRNEFTFEYGCIPGQLLAYHKADVLGWIPASRQYTAKGGTHTITLERLAAPTTSNSYLYARIPVSGTSYYTIEARFMTGIEINGAAWPSTTFTTNYDENIPGPNKYEAGDPQPGCVVINKVSSHPYPVGEEIVLQGTDSNHDGWWDDPTNSGTNGGSCFEVGSTFSAMGGAVKVNVVSKTSHSFTVAITAPSFKGSDYYPLSHARILDTATTLGGHKGPLGAGKTLDLRVLGVGGIPAQGVSAVVLNLWAAAPSTSSSLTVYPTNLAKPGTQNLQLVKNRTSSNLVTVAPGPDGKVRIANAAGTVHLMADVVGYYGSPYGGLLYSPVSGQGVYPPSGPCVFFCTLPANSDTEVGIQGYGALPPSGVTAVALQVTSQFSPQDGKLFIYPKGAPQPAHNDIAYPGGDIHTWLVIVKTGNGGNIMVRNTGAGSAYLNFRVVGWYGAGAEYTFRTVKPARLVPASTSIAASATKSIVVGGVTGIPAGDAKAVLVNVSLIHPTNTGFLNVSASGSGSDVNTYDTSFYNKVDANAVISGIGAANKVDFSDQYSATHFAVDVLGWFGAP